MYRWLRTRMGRMGAIAVSSLIFTLAHYPTLNAMPVNFVSGIVFAWAYERTGSVIPGMIIHGAFNTIAVLLTAMS
ncbi:CPBP family intramembrane metalloprotease [Paenibacillus sp. B01]|nr:CPBP family intramembrane metalloprotease [Paenibacillus sp. B01]